MDKKPKVVFTYVEAGMGHIIPMQGISKAFKEKYGDKCEIVDSYIFSQSKYKSVRDMGNELSAHTKRTASSFLYNRFEAFTYLLSWRLVLKFLDLHFKKPRKDFMNEMKELQPDLLVNSYYLPGHLAVESNKKGITNTLIATYSPDNYIYSAWDRRCNVLITNNSEASKHGEKRGFKKHQIRQVPFIYKDSIIKTTCTKEQAREELGLPKDKFTVLFSNGAYGAKKTEVFIKKLIDEKLPISIVVICGKNEALKNSIVTLAKDKAEGTFVQAVGFTDKMPEYIKASDMALGKSGMNTIMEEAYLGCPNVIIAEANRLEEHISRFCVRENISLKQKNPKKAIEIVKKCYFDKEYFNKLKTDLQSKGLTDGSEQAADVLFELLKTKYPNL